MVLLKKTNMVSFNVVEQMITYDFSVISWDIKVREGETEVIVELSRRDVDFLMRKACPKDDGDMSSIIGDLSCIDDGQSENLFVIDHRPHTIIMKRKGVILKERTGKFHDIELAEAKPR